MATANNIVNNALIALGVNNQFNADDPYLQEQLFNALKRLIYRWSSVDISLGITIPTVPADELGNPESTDDAMITSLAIDAQTIAKVTASAALRKAQKIYYRQLKSAYGLWPQQSMPNSMPIGAGNNIGPRAQRYFPSVDTVGSDTDTGLGT